MSNQGENKSTTRPSGSDTEAVAAPSAASKATGHPDPVPTAAVAGSGSTFSRVLFSVRRWWLQDVVGTVNQTSVIEKRREDCALSERYLFMTAMSGGIAILGMLLSSPAVVIGAMLLSPLMGPIMGLGFALAIGDYPWLKQSARSLAWGTLIAVLLCAMLVFFSPIQTITPEIAARTRPNLFDLMVALFSALAGAYAMIRGREGTIVGVAIATALMPPLAAVGFGLATWNWTVFSGALLLYVTNLLTIALTAWGMARLYGFRTTLSERNTLFQNVAVASVFLGLAIPLAFSLQQIAWEANAQRIVRSEIVEKFDDRSRVSDLEIEFGNESISIFATVFTSQLRPEAEVATERALASRLGRPVELTLIQSQAATASAAEQAELSASRDREEAAESARADDLAKRLALVAGVDDADVLVDRTRRKAMVRAKPLDGASLVAYRTLEQRIAATEPEWTIELLPPRGDLPDLVEFNEEGEPTVAGTQALLVVAWARQRIDLPIELVGNGENAARAAEILAEQGAQVSVEPSFGPVRVRWAPIDEQRRE